MDGEIAVDPLLGRIVSLAAVAAAPRHGAPCWLSMHARVASPCLLVVVARGFFERRACVGNRLGRPPLQLAVVLDGPFAAASLLGRVVSLLAVAAAPPRCTVRLAAAVGSLEAIQT
jgi:hypothetical protein